MCGVQIIPQLHWPTGAPTTAKGGCPGTSLREFRPSQAPTIAIEGETIERQRLGP